MRIQCSCCGHRSREYKVDRYDFDRIGKKYTDAGWDSYGDAFYCPGCVRTWAARNGNDRKLWGKAHTQTRVLELIAGCLLDEIERMKGAWEP